MALDALFAYPGDLHTISGGYRYDRRVLAELSAQGCRVEPVSLGEARPGARMEDTAAAGERLAMLPGTGPVIVDGLALGVLPEAAERVAARRPLVALVHHPLALETGLDAATRAALAASETRALAAAAAVIVTSPATAGTLRADYAVPHERIRVALPGVDPQPFAAPSSAPPVRLVSVGALIPRKGYGTYLDALARLADLDWRARIVGGGAAEYERTLSELAAGHGLADRVTFCGPVPHRRLAGYYLAADVFVVPSLYEGYGMVVSEALAHGLPVVGTDGGALADTIPDGAGLKVPAGDASALAGALRAVVAGAGTIETMAARARDLAARLPRWDAAAKVFRETLEELR